MKILLTSVLLLIAPLMQKWQVDKENSQVTFKIKNAGFTVDGSFGGLEAAIVFDENDLESSSIKASVSVETIDTGIEKRDKHLKAKGYFHVEAFPRIEFASSNIRKKGGGYEAEGTLSIKGVSKKIVIPFTFEENTFKGTLALDRVDYGVGKKSLILSREVQISMNVKVVPNP